MDIYQESGKIQSNSRRHLQTTQLIELPLDPEVILTTWIVRTTPGDTFPSREVMALYPSVNMVHNWTGHMFLTANHTTQVGQ